MIPQVEPYPEHPDFKEPVPHQGAILPVQSPQGGAVLHQQQDLAGGSTCHQNTPLSYAPLGTDTFRRKFQIPGTGEITDPNLCGFWFSTAACSEDSGHFTKHIEQHCDDPSCPICFGHWASKQGARISERLRGYIEAAGRGQRTLDCSVDVLWHQDNSRYLNHYVLSAPKTVITQDMTIDQIKASGKVMAAHVGITGGFMGFHPYRIKRAIQTQLSYACREAVRMNEDDRERKFWELVRTDVLQLGSWEHYVEWGPHFHIIGFGRLPMNPFPKGSPEAKDWAETTFAGWLPRWIRHVATETKFNGHAIKDPIAELAAYILSHAAYVPGKKAVAWIGCCTPGRLKKVGKPDKQSYNVVCPVCGCAVIMGGMDNKKFIPNVDADGSDIPYRLRFHWQKYQIQAKAERTPCRISAKALAVWGPAGPPGESQA